MGAGKVFKTFDKASEQIEMGLKKVPRRIPVKEQKEFERKKLKKLFEK